MTVQSKILIADDDASIRLVLSQAFTRLGYQVRATSNATTLLKWVSEGEGDLVITDVVMPGEEQPFDVLPRIKKQRPKLPVIIMSAHEHPDDRGQRRRDRRLRLCAQALRPGRHDRRRPPGHWRGPADNEAAKAQARALRDERLPLIGRSPPLCRMSIAPWPAWWARTSPC